MCVPLKKGRGGGEEGGLMVMCGHSKGEGVRGSTEAFTMYVLTFGILHLFIAAIFLLACVFGLSNLDAVINRLFLVSISASLHVQ